MRNQPRLNRILLKLSGELLRGTDCAPVDSRAADSVAARLKRAAALDVQLALVVGAGNIIRGSGVSQAGLDRINADHMGMLATVINSLGLAGALRGQGLEVRVQSAIPMAGMVEPFDARQALQHLEAGRIVIFAGGTGHPFFTTDTTAALRACEIGADAILKATKVNGVYSADPKRVPGATRYRRLAYQDALHQRLRVMDSTAFSLCMDNAIPIVVFDFAENGVLDRIIEGDFASATLVDDGETEPA